MGRENLGQVPLQALRLNKAKSDKPYNNFFILIYFTIEYNAKTFRTII